MSDLEELRDQVRDAVDEDGLEGCGHYRGLSMVMEVGEGQRGDHCCVRRRDEIVVKRERILRRRGWFEGLAAAPHLADDRQTRSTVMMTIWLIWNVLFATSIPFFWIFLSSIDTLGVGLYSLPRDRTIRAVWLNVAFLNQPLPTEDPASPSHDLISSLVHQARS